MSRGSKTDYETVVKIFTVYATNRNINQTAKSVGINYNTVKSIINKYQGKKEFAKLLDKKSEEFSKWADEINDKLMRLLERRVDRALEQEERLDEMIEEINRDKDISDNKKREMMKTISDISMKRGVDITTMIGTLRDKAAVVRGELTENTKIEISLKD